MTDMVTLLDGAPADRRPFAAKVEVHTRTIRNGKVIHGHFRGVTLYRVVGAT